MKHFQNRNGTEIYKRCLSGIEGFCDHVQNGTLSDSAFLSPEQLKLDSHYGIVRTYLQFLYAQYEAKYAELTSSFIESVNKEEYLLFALCGRSLLELTATLRYYAKKLDRIISDVENAGIVTPEKQKELVQILDNHARGGRFNWSQFHCTDWSTFAAHLVEARGKKSNKSSDKSPDKINPDQVNIMTAIEKWAKEEPVVLLAYEYFCELVHPNLGSNFLVMGAKEGQLVVGKSSSKDIAKQLCEQGLTMIAATAIREGARYMGELFLLKELLLREETEPRGYPG